MQRSIVLAWSRLAPLALLSGCLVSFNDYPLGDLGRDGGSAGKGGTDAVAGSAPEAGSTGVSTGGSLQLGGGTGAVPTGGTDSAGSTAIGGGGTTGDSTAGSSTEGGGAAAEVDPNLIDDFEDGDEQILEQQGRKGAWFVQNDGSGAQTPDAGARALPSDFMVARSGSTRGMHTSGGPFAMWGALVGTSLASNGADAAPYDLSGYQGIKLWVRTNSTAPTAAKEVRLNFVTPTATNGGPIGSGSPNSPDYWGFAIPLTSKWVQVDVAFSKLKQLGYGRPRATSLDLTSVTGLQFSFPVNVTFDLWIDDLTLY